jgi:exosome complex RNA-binding protein Csl4
MLNPAKLLKIAEKNYGCYTGICANCGKIHSQVEPDASQYECENCGEYTVFGCENILIVDGHVKYLIED